MAALDRTTAWILPTVAGLVTGAGLSAAAAAGIATAPSDWLAASPAGDALQASFALLRQGLDRQPTMLLAGGAAAAVPLFAALAALVRGLVSMRAPASDLGRDAPRTAGRRPARTAWIELEPPVAPPLPIGELVRIGCSDDCDLALGDAGLSETHALIQRTADSEFYIFDVSDAATGGIAVNGAQAIRSRLRDGDRIDLGTARVVFRTDQALAASPAAA